MLTMKLTQKTNKSVLARLKQKIDALHGQSTMIGYFKEQPMHPTANMSYAALAHTHAYSNLYPERNVFNYMKPWLGGSSASQTKFFKDLFIRHFKYNTTLNLDIMMNKIGREYMEKGKNVFGNASLLTVTGNPTPLVDTGELRDHFAYKTTIHYQVRYR